MSGVSVSRRPTPIVHQRDQDKSTFTDILERLLAATPGAEGAALVDGTGETVDYAGRHEAFDLKVAAAHWQIVCGELALSERLIDLRQITVRAHARSYVVRLLKERYVLVLILHRHAAFAASERAFQEADARLSVEAGWSAPRDTPRWFGARVETERPDKTRPARLWVANGWQPVEVMGCMVGLGPREKGFRVRLPSGAEMMLVRERLGRWFTDERFE